MNRKKCSLIMLVVVLSSIACKEKATKTFDKEKGIAYFEKDDKELKRLQDTAQANIQSFINSLEKNSPTDGYQHMIKSDFTDKVEHEHMWSDVVSYSNNQFTCIFADSAYIIAGIKKGDTILVKRQSVDDWVIYDADGNQSGFFSEKYLTGEK